MESEDVFTFYHEEIESEFAVIWSKIVENPEYSDSCDVRLECTDGQYCHSHRSLLSISSECLRNAFESYNSRNEQISDEEELVIVLPDSVPYEELNSIINYIYNGIVSIPESRLCRFLEVCRILTIKGLEDINLAFLVNLDNSKHILISDSKALRLKHNYNFHVKELNQKECQFLSLDIPTLDLSRSRFTTIKDIHKRELPIVSKKFRPSVGQSLIAKQIKPRRVGLQGRKPQVGSPLITEDFKIGDRYKCKVCLRSYQWKKSLVRHYKDLHPNCVELVTE